MGRPRRNSGLSQRPDPSEAKDLVELAARMGIPTEDAMRQVQLISDASASDRLSGDRSNAGERDRK
jgi:hypothetical protein